jgi:DNA-binding Lrp family transcriptional regulator
MELDDVDRRILAALVEDGRISVNELATRASVSRATAYSRFERLRRSGVVRGFHADVDPVAIGHPITAIVLVDVNQGEWPRLRAEMIQLPGVEWLALTSGTSDFLLLVRAPDMASLRDLVLQRLQAMKAVRSTQTIFIMDEQSRPASLDAIGRLSAGR